MLPTQFTTDSGLGRGGVGGIIGAGLILLALTILVVTTCIVVWAKKRKSYLLHGKGKSPVKYKFTEGGCTPTTKEPDIQKSGGTISISVNTNPAYTATKRDEEEEDYYTEVNQEQQQAEIDELYVAIDENATKYEVDVDLQYVNADELEREVLKRNLAASYQRDGDRSLTHIPDVKEPTEVENRRNNPNYVNNLDELLRQAEGIASDEDEEGYVPYDPKKRTLLGQGEISSQQENEDTCIYENTCLDDKPRSDMTSESEAIWEKHKCNYENDLEGLMEKVKKLEAEEKKAKQEGKHAYVNDLARLVDTAEQLEAAEKMKHDKSATLADGGGEENSRGNAYVNDLAELVQKAIESEEAQAQRGSEASKERELTSSYYVNDLSSFLRQ